MLRCVCSCLFMRVCCKSIWLVVSVGCCDLVVLIVVFVGALLVRVVGVGLYCCCFCLLVVVCCFVFVVCCCFCV